MSNSDATSMGALEKAFVIFPEDPDTVVLRPGSRYILMDSEGNIIPLTGIRRMFETPSALAPSATKQHSASNTHAKKNEKLGGTSQRHQPYPAPTGVKASSRNAGQRYPPSTDSDESGSPEIVALRAPIRTGVDRQRKADASKVENKFKANSNMYADRTVFPPEAMDPRLLKKMEHRYPLSPNSSGTTPYGASKLYAGTNKPAPKQDAYQSKEDMKRETEIDNTVKEINRLLRDINKKMAEIGEFAGRSSKGSGTNIAKGLPMQFAIILSHLAYLDEHQDSTYPEHAAENAFKRDTWRSTIKDLARVHSARLQKLAEKGVNTAPLDAHRELWKEAISPLSGRVKAAPVGGRSGKQTAAEKQAEAANRAAASARENGDALMGR